MYRSPSCLSLLLAVALAGFPSSSHALPRVERPDAPVVTPAADVPSDPAIGPASGGRAQTLEPREVPAPRPEWQRRKWGGYLGGVERSVSAAIARAHVDHPSVIAGGPTRVMDPPERGVSSPDVGDAAVDGAIPARLWFGPAVPNPTTGFATLRYDLPRAASVRFAVFDVAGRAVRDESRRIEAGRHTFALDLGAARGPGVYFVRMVCDGRTVGTRRMVVRF